LLTQSKINLSHSYIQFSESAKTKLKSCRKITSTYVVGLKVMISCKEIRFWKRKIRKDINVEESNLRLATVRSSHLPTNFPLCQTSFLWSNDSWKGTRTKTFISNLGQLNSFYRLSLFTYNLWKASNKSNLQTVFVFCPSVFHRLEQINLHEKY